ncbi:MAG: hypothetical protein JJ908_12005 [Rhizobiales bacterium]|nr:hypothetical protein [Hyphomicrobiales bacterium]MBO6699548.1 hypothetical protein [Hyphomicrobiales bacterium]MBO6737086.1 hypothetical protein [Hyphomicrobiales bacterium]MBO6911840.1 hypothetical protein [Hyphomicrobiales bacterium]MBO6954777.1 hypothetical protein [Hyphomicrobiales bacterium]
MADTPKKRSKTLSESDITTKRGVGRRTFMGIMAAGSVGAALAPTTVAAADVDNGTWTDSGSCPRLLPAGLTDSDGGAYADPAGAGTYTGYTDQDNGNITDDGGRGRGAPYC